MSNEDGASEQEDGSKLRSKLPLPNEGRRRNLPNDLPRARGRPRFIFSKSPELPEIVLRKWHGVERESNSDQEEEDTGWDWPLSLSFTLLGLVTAAVFAGFALSKGKTPAALTAMAFIPPFLFASFERYVNKPDSEYSNTDKYYSDLNIWGYGMVLGVGLVVLYLFARVFILSIGRPSTKASISTLAKAGSILKAATDTSVAVADSTLVALASHSVDTASLALWHDGLLLFFLSTALTVVMYALANISRSSI